MKVSISHAIIAALALALVASSLMLNAVRSDRDAWREASRQWEAAAEGWRGAFEVSENRRSEERQNAAQSADASAQQCLAQIAQARSSARVIERIVTREVPHDSNGCPVRERVDPGLLRGALTPD